MIAPPPLAQLRQALPHLPPRLQELARFIIQHEFDAATRPMRELAAASGASPASFTRLAQAIGYIGWDAMRDALIERREKTGRPFSARLRDVVRTAGDDRITSAAELAGASLASDAAAVAQLQADPIGPAAEALHRAERIWTAGFRSCRLVAQLLTYEFSIFLPRIVQQIGAERPEDLDLGALQRGDVLLLVSIAPYTRNALLAARAARDAGCVLITLTDDAGAPVARDADHRLVFDIASPGFFPSLAGAVATAQALAAATFLLCGEVARDRLREAEERTAALAQYLPQEEPQA
ncbi:MurR/RpiR family transcriptional regulator [Roseomonas marmotae]|uniref:MurR/RpiR family transcriptional regulator n=1 Tax=Roseomonas marmotae TaxID=2768161 RepID=A0ABS3K6H4_9PROT|nr:MurR/RpiR family transcriptional regulator [Roseomonas marmotae]MBO1073048.1 MurR/RpiR family transcriptional regulator [Roseomonas marmotae]